MRMKGYSPTLVFNKHLGSVFVAYQSEPSKYNCNTIQSTYHYQKLINELFCGMFFLYKRKDSFHLLPHFYPIRLTPTDRHAIFMEPSQENAPTEATPKSFQKQKVMSNYQSCLKISVDKSEEFMDTLWIDSF